MTMNCAEKLRKADISPSPQRVAIFEYVHGSKQHPTAETIFRALKPSMPALSLTTVYNTLKLLLQKKVIHGVIIEDGEMRFDGDTVPHAHFKCMKCGRIFDFSTSLTDDVCVPGLPPGFQVAEAHLCYRGICADCQDSSKPIIPG